MVVKFHHNLTVTSHHASALECVPQMLNVSELKDLTVWVTEFALIVVTMPIAQLQMVGVEMVVRTQERHYATLLMVYASILVPETTKLQHLLLVVSISVTVTLMVYVTLVPVIASVPLKMVLLEAQETPSVIEPLVFVLIHSTAVVVPPLWTM